MRVRSGQQRVDAVTVKIRRLLLRRHREVWSGRAIRIDDALGQQVSHGLPMAWLVAAIQVIKGMVFTDDHDHVFDRRTGLDAIM